MIIKEKKGKNNGKAKTEALFLFFESAPLMVEALKPHVVTPSNRQMEGQFWK